MAGPRAAARAGEIRAGHGGIKSRETSVARIGTARVGGKSGLLESQCGVGDAPSRPATYGPGRHDVAAQQVYPSPHWEGLLMSASSDAIERRFGDGGPSGEGTED